MEGLFYALKKGTIMNVLLKNLFKNAEILHVASYEVRDADDEGTTFIGEAQTLEEANLIFAQEDKFADGLRAIIALDQNGHMFGNKEVRSEWVKATPALNEVVDAMIEEEEALAA